MLKQVLFIITALFIFFVKAENTEIQVNSNNNLSKSFTAHCQTAETCNYVFIASTTGQAYEVGLSIYVNMSPVSTGSYSVTSLTSATISFPVSDGSNIMITVDEIDKASSDMLLTLYDNFGNVVADSKQLEFTVKNFCLDVTCEVSLERTPIGWPTNLAAKLYINETVVAEVNSSTSNSVNFNFKPYDILKMKIVHDPSTPAIPDGFEAGVYFGSDALSLWRSNLYYTPMVLNSASCSNLPPPPPPNPTGSPFGGLLYPITQEQIKEFLARTGTSYSTLWYRETEAVNRMFV